MTGQLQSLIPVLTRLVTTLATERESIHESTSHESTVLPPTVWTGGPHVHAHISPHAQTANSPSSPLHGLFSAIARLGEGDEAQEAEHDDTLGIGAFGELVQAEHDHSDHPDHPEHWQAGEA